MIKNKIEWHKCSDIPTQNSTLLVRVWFEGDVLVQPQWRYQIWDFLINCEHPVLGLTTFFIGPVRYDGNNIYPPGENGYFEWRENEYGAKIKIFPKYEWTYLTCRIDSGEESEGFPKYTILDMTSF